MSIQDIVDGISEGIEAQDRAGIDHKILIQTTSDLGRIISTLYGVLVVIIYILVPLVIALELLYICFPVVREQADKLLIKIESRGFVGKSLGFTLRDAREAIHKANMSEKGESPLWVYLKLKCTSVMVVMFVIFLVLNGRGNIIRFVWGLIESAVGRWF